VQNNSKAIEVAGLTPVLSWDELLNFFVIIVLCVILHNKYREGH